MLEKKTKTFVYKQVQYIPRSFQVDLSTLVHAAVGKLKTVGQRRQGLGLVADESHEWLVIGEYQGDADMFFGVLMRYSPGTAAATLIDDAAARVVKVETFLAPLGGTSRREFIDGALFFGISGNHVVLMQSTSVRDRTLENHLQWLLHEAKVLPGDHTFDLVDRPSPVARKLIEQSPVRSIEIDGGLFTAPGQAVAREERISGSAGSMSLPQKAIDMVLSLLPERDRHKLDFSGLDATRLSYVLQVKFEGRRGMSPNDTLDRIGRAMRNADGVNTVIKLDNGAEIENDVLRISGKVRVETRDGLPVSPGIFEQMREWLLERIVDSAN